MLPANDSRIGERYGCSFITLLGSGPQDDGTLDLAARQRVDYLLQKNRRHFGLGPVVCFGRYSNPNWYESEAACLKRHLLAGQFQDDPPIDPDSIEVDPRPRSTSQSLQLIPEWLDRFRSWGHQPQTVWVVTNGAYLSQFDELFNGLKLDRLKQQGVTVRFDGAPDFAMQKADFRRLRAAEWKAAVDPFDTRVNQWRSNGRTPPLRRRLQQAADLALMAGLTVAPLLGYRPAPGPLPVWPAGTEPTWGPNDRHQTP